MRLARRTILFVGCILPLGCGVKEAKDAANTLQEGGPSVESASAIEYVSDVSWLKDTFGHLDQASIPWVWGTFLMTQEVGGVSGIPVLFDHENPPDLKVDLKIEVAGSEQLGNRSPITIYDGKDVPLKVGKMSAMITIDENTTEYEKIPESVPLVGGKTIYPLYFIVSMNDYDWSSAGEDSKTSMQDAINSKDLSGKQQDVQDNIPVPWLDCETVKITVGYKGTASKDGEYQISSEKFLAADPSITVKLLGQLSDAFSPIVEEQTGMDLAALSEALSSVDTPDCEAPDDADKALFSE